MTEDFQVVEPDDIYITHCPTTINEVIYYQYLIIATNLKSIYWCRDTLYIQITSQYSLNNLIQIETQN